MVHPKFSRILHRALNDTEGAVRTRYLQRRVRELETQYRQLQTQVNTYLERERPVLNRHREMLCLDIKSLQNQLDMKEAEISGLQQSLTEVTHQRDHLLEQFHGSEDARAQEQAMYEEFKLQLTQHHDDLRERIIGIRLALQQGPINDLAVQVPGNPQGHVAAEDPVEEGEEEEEEEEEPEEEPSEEEEEELEEEPMEEDEQEEEPDEPAGPESEDEGQVDD